MLDALTDPAPPPADAGSADAAPEPAAPASDGGGGGAEEASPQQQQEEAATTDTSAVPTAAEPPQGPTGAAITPQALEKLARAKSDVAAAAESAAPASDGAKEVASPDLKC